MFANLLRKWLAKHNCLRLALCMMQLISLTTAILITTTLMTLLQGAPQPNVILMVADDLGYGDLSCYGAKAITTPRLDRLAEQGTRFTDAHSFSGICMPSRYTILSGRYAFRARVARGYACHFEASQVLLPMVMKSAGYRTAMIGKWHNGFGSNPDVDWNAPLVPGPLEFGFDSFFGTPRTHSEPPLVLMRDRSILGLEKDDPIRVDHSPGTGAHGKQIGGAKAMAMRPDEKLDLMQAAEAETWLQKQSAAQPFFLYLAWQAPHNPINPEADFQKKSKAGRYGDYVQQLDHCVGRVLDALEKSGLAENTLVVFTSDNAGRYEGGAMRAGHRTNGSLLGQKTDVWEGGHRVPFLVRWPGRVPAKSLRVEYFHHVDLMATFTDCVGATLPEGSSPDGRSELSAFLDPVKSPAKRKEGIHHGSSSLALRQGSWVYIPEQGSGGKSAPQAAKPWSMSYRDMKFLNSDVDENGKIKEQATLEQLYDLKVDLPQTTNLASREPERLAKMRERFKEITASPRKAR
jgi:arylsulfatase A-like enzyme